MIVRPEQPIANLPSSGPTTGLRIIPSAEPGATRPALAELVAADTEHVIREACVAEELFHIQSGLGHIRGVLEDADVSCCQRRRGESHGLPKWQIPWHHSKHHTNGLVGHVRLFGADARGIGIGTQLLAGLIAMADAEDWAKVHWVADEGNRAAREIFDRLFAASALIGNACMAGVGN